MTAEQPSRKLLPLLRCPITNSRIITTDGGLTVRATEKHEGKTVTYQVIDGIPVLLADKATFVA